MVRCHCWVLGAIAAAIAGCKRRGVVMTHFDRLDVVPLLGAMVCENLITHLNQIFLCLNSLVSHACVTLLF